MITLPEDDAITCPEIEFEIRKFILLRVFKFFEGFMASIVVAEQHPLLKDKFKEIFDKTKQQFSIARDILNGMKNNKNFKINIFELEALKALFPFDGEELVIMQQKHQSILESKLNGLQSSVDILQSNVENGIGELVTADSKILNKLEEIKLSLQTIQEQKKVSFAGMEIIDVCTNNSDSGACCCC